MVKTLLPTNEVQADIKICKSDSKVCGRELRLAHYRLGKELGDFISSSEFQNPTSIALLIMMRGGLPFGFGIADRLEEHGHTVNILFSDKNTSVFTHDCEKLIIVDAVINTGKSILGIIKENNLTDEIIATNVLSEIHLGDFEMLNTYAVRLSQNSFQGSKEKTIVGGRGPDTGDRLFKNDFFLVK